MKCGDNRCIPGYLFCDFKDDCFDGSDERECGKIGHNYIKYGHKKRWKHKHLLIDTLFHWICFQRPGQVSSMELQGGTLAQPVTVDRMKVSKCKKYAEDYI